MQNREYLFEVVPIRLLLIVLLVFYHAFAIFSGAWAPLESYPAIPAYEIIDKLSYAVLLETFVFISGYIFGFQVRTKGKDTILNLRKLIIGKFKRLIVPSIVFSILYIICLETSADSIWTVSYNVLCGVGHMWFLPMLFWCFIFTYFIELTGLKGKSVFPILLLAMFGSVIPLPLRLNTALYYILFFYMGYYIQKEDIRIKIKSETVIPLSLICFAVTYLVKQSIDNHSLFFGGGIIDNQSIQKGIRFFILKLSRVVCALSGVVALMSISKIIVRRSDTSKWSGIMKLSNCCFGVYLFQQFILKLLNKSDMPLWFNPYLYPWVAFIITLVLSLLLTTLIRKTQIGRQLL